MAREKLIQVRVTEEEKAGMLRGARRAGLSVSEWVRQRALGVKQRSSESGGAGKGAPARMNRGAVATDAGAAPLLAASAERRWSGKGRWECSPCLVRNDRGGGCPKCGHKMRLGFGS